MSYQATLPATIQSAGNRTLRFTISSDSPDRMNDTIAAAGWDLRAYRKNPVVLWAHDRTTLPVAKTKDIRVVGNRLVATAEFAPKAIHPLSDQIYQLLKAGFLTGCSVGFRPITWTKNRAGGCDYTAQELTEWSIVPVGAHPDALLEQRADKQAVMKWLKSKPADREIVFKLKPDPLPLPKYRIDPALLGSALAMSIGAAFTSPSFQRELRATVNRRVDAAMKRLRGRLD